MCGIAGFLENTCFRTNDNMEYIARAMGDSIRHRGPDGGEVWKDAATGIALIHRRLAVVDLSPTGAQPMTSACGRYVITYNGEVYNHEELRPKLSASGILFRGSSDTEVVLEGCAKWGVKNTVSKLIGMFAFALWDREDKRLFLVRDRLGIKPLYWTQTNSTFVFGSELKALRCHPCCNNTINRDAVASFMRHNYIGDIQTIYTGVQKLRPGWILDVKINEPPRLEQYWSLEEVARNAKMNPLDLSETEAIDALEKLLIDATGRRMIADVPLGAFLSGGIDSSVVVALMQAQSDKPVRSFSIGFHEKTYNEANHAATIAKHLGTNHTELYVTSQEARDFIPLIPKYYDEPFADSSQIPTFLVSKMTREHVTVALSGDGGDELFSGYTRYFTAAKFEKLLFGQPKFLRSLEAGTIRTMSPAKWDVLLSAIPGNFLPSQVGDKLYKLANILSGNRDDIYRNLISHWSTPDNIVINGREPHGLIWDNIFEQKFPNTIDRMQFFDLMTYLPDDILTKVDRASMAVSLEARIPLLDHRVVDFAWSLPDNMKIRNGQGKWILRQVLNRYVPRELFDRPKMGFGVPLDKWLRGPLRDWAEELLSPQALKETGLLREKPIREKWEEHISGSRNWQYLLWDVLMLQSWHNEYM